MNVLFMIALVAASGKPIPHATVQCMEIARMMDNFEGEPDFDGAGAVLVTDSRGHMYIDTMPDMTLHCTARAKGFRTTTFSYMPTHAEHALTVRLPKEIL